MAQCPGGEYTAWDEAGAGAGTGLGLGWLQAGLCRVIVGMGLAWAGYQDMMQAGLHTAVGAA